MLTFDEAIATLEKSITPAIHLEDVPLEECLHRTLATGVIADRALPPFNRATMDGFAVVASDVKNGVTLPIVGTVSAGDACELEGSSGRCVSIATGASVPIGFDAVVKHESTRFTKTEVEFLLDDVMPGTAIHPKGADALCGEVLIEPSTFLGQQHIGIAAAVGAICLTVRKSIRLCVLSSGDELVESSETPKTHQIRNSNSSMLRALFESMGCHVSLQSIGDDEQQTVKVLEEVCDANDVVVTIGGISAGKKDFVIPALEALSAHHIIKGVAMQPGKPVYVGTCQNAIVLGLPGNPVSALVCATLFGKAVLRKFMGLQVAPKFHEVTLLNDVKPNRNREMYRPCVREFSGVTIPEWQGSGDLVHTVNTTGIVRIPKQADDIVSGTTVQYLPWN
ncbi:MAG: molybdopterin molybdotransferase MoeA [Planctomycetota bacterium]|nr:molybdopterin molybdotransferase MoeA [Planctomycetota bacterium]